ncbi:unannotated protein [freshwater metagenome]|uniref:Unannotated protein n=1 Tax=freshwater metagenome TaxID=449393 RepID=A0A6J6WRJ8_9ZZZZ
MVLIRGDHRVRGDACSAVIRGCVAGDFDCAGVQGASPEHTGRRDVRGHARRAGNEQGGGLRRAAGAKFGHGRNREDVVLTVRQTRNDYRAHRARSDDRRAGGADSGVKIGTHDVAGDGRSTGG